MEKTDGDKFKSICTKVREDGPYVETGDNPNLIVQKLEANPNTLGIFGFSYVDENKRPAEGARPINGVRRRTSRRSRPSNTPARARCSSTSRTSTSAPSPA